MCTIKVLSLLAATTSFFTTISAVSETTNPFQLPGTGDVRSPCPGLNALANHGLLPRNGKGIDLAILSAGTLAGFNLGQDAATLVGTQALASSATGNASTFDLDNLNEHDPQVIEHDGSMSRTDSFWGDNHSFNQEAWDRTLSTWGDNETITFAVAAAERTARFVFGAAANPEFNATFANSGSLLEYSLMLSAFGDPVEGNANKTLAVFMMENERLPFSLGWTPPTTQITVSTAQAMAAKIAALL
ncbi:Chloroperoxidase [Pseudomassariella vexata]|uniref:Chloroperoxidase n=1 Tax=Pseudomassariella vexata TaxID=1141098 RepID=A0A1Y2E877_9PEZI|nr:Chloroperoxidase [Pseudomassariella vexata]ORY67524.1 Chloroperoxidase [Pseudomassariella vexata]